MLERPTSAAEDSPPPPPPPRPGSKTAANKVCLMVVMLQSTTYHARLDIRFAAVSKFESNYENHRRINLGLHVISEGVFFFTALFLVSDPLFNLREFK